MVIKNEGKKSKQLLTLYPTICFPKFLEMCLTPKIPLPKSKLESGQKMHFCLGPVGFEGFYRVSHKKYTLFWRAIAPLNFELGIKVRGVLEFSGSQL